MKRLILLSLILSGCQSWAQIVLKTQDAQILFVSEAPIELISATSESCGGVLIPESGSFAFKVSIRSFEGFNSPLQKEHFNENYLESGRFPNSTFEGRILDEVDWTQEGEITVRVKGKMVIHNVSDERLIVVRLHIFESGNIGFEAEFEVALETHDITVPRIVSAKISESITVKVNGILK